MSAGSYTLMELAKFAIAGGADPAKVEESLHYAPINEDHRRDLFAVHAPLVPMEFPRLIEVVALKEGGTYQLHEGDDPREIRWRWHWADLMLAASRKVV